MAKGKLSLGVALLSIGSIIFPTCTTFLHVLKGSLLHLLRGYQRIEVQSNKLWFLIKLAWDTRSKCVQINIDIGNIKRFGVPIKHTHTSCCQKASYLALHTAPPSLKARAYKLHLHWITYGKRRKIWYEYSDMWRSPIVKLAKQRK